MIEVQVRYGVRYRIVGEISPERPDRELPDDVRGFLLLTPLLSMALSPIVREELTG